MCLTYASSENTSWNHADFWHFWTTHYVFSLGATGSVLSVINFWMLRTTPWRLFVNALTTICDHSVSCSWCFFRRKLSVCPILEGEDQLRLLNYQHNMITKIQHLSTLKRLIFLDLYDNQIEEISGLSSLKSLRVLMLGKNRWVCVREM